tara:strand:- start:1098 stop:2546 length:1449 start_codon:yes stop_codon:yes gene_type:complete
MIPILSGNVASALPTGYNVANSARFNDGDSAYLDHTHGAVTSTRKNTFSFWVKRGLLSSYQYIISTRNGTSTNRDGIAFNDSDQIDIRYNAGSSSPIRLTTTRVFRDPTAWYHIVVAVDTEQGTASNRIKVYINGTQETTFATANYMDEDYDFALNAKTDQTTDIGNDARSDGSYFDGYLAEFVAIDGTQNAVTDFGEFDEDSPTIWKPKDVSGLTFGNAGFYLDFENSSELGTDVSGNSNTFSENNLDATDQATDTCTNNFCVMNPLDNAINQATFSEGNCKLVTASSPYYYNTGTFGLSSGKFYFECKVASSAPSDYNLIGIAGEMIGGMATDSELGGTGTYGYGYHGNNGKYRSDVPTGSGAGYAYGTTYSTSIIGVYIDLDNNKLYFAKDGTVQNSGTGIDIGTSPPHGVFFPAGGEQSTSGSATLEFNFGGCPAFSISSGNSDPNGYGNFEYSTTITGDGASKSFFAICTKNLAEYG